MDNELPTENVITPDSNKSWQPPKRIEAIRSLLQQKSKETGMSISSSEYDPDRQPVDGPQIKYVTPEEAAATQPRKPDQAHIDARHPNPGWKRDPAANSRILYNGQMNWNDNV